VCVDPKKERLIYATKDIGRRSGKRAKDLASLSHLRGHLGPSRGAFASQRRIQKQSALNPRKRGPKPKLKSASLDPADDA
jgi:hypothetical protein